jgi:arylsulfatase A-like enzyme
MLKRRDFLSIAPALTMAGGSGQALRSRPNFIVFVMDDLGYADLGYQGASDLKTPNIDGLAHSGVRFTNWYSTGASCVASRIGLLTGRYPERTNYPSRGWRLPPGERTIASLLKPLGYTTGITGKWHLGDTPDAVPNAHGFDDFFGFHLGCVDFYSHRFYWDGVKRDTHDLWRNRTEIFEDGQYLTELITREAARFVTENRTKPFFLYVPYNAVHYPMHAPAKYVDRFRRLEPERRMYAAMLSAADDSIGEIMGLVRKLGLYERTVVFFASDNGATREARAGLNQQPATAGSNRPFRGYKFSLFDGGIHMPAIMSWPGTLPAGRTVHDIGSHLDILPTFCNIADAPPPVGLPLDGRDILPAITSGKSAPRGPLFWSAGGQLAVRRGQWKLVERGNLADGTPHARMQGDDVLFLSNLDEDPGESKNLRHQQPALTDELASLAHQWREEMKANSVQPD